ncbi:hypothetical protein LWI29_013250 [Acer saccharum]|uniref:Uncharacterized protein n=1 Tax=Acer saccharum TaxID=4024 RepID=A0AA39W2S9_ACESA|nr:hypothetical protein LWI29_013250 [Acer saccharum]
MTAIQLDHRGVLSFPPNGEKDSIAGILETLGMVNVPIVSDVVAGTEADVVAGLFYTCKISRYLSRINPKNKDMRPPLMLTSSEGEEFATSISNRLLHDPDCGYPPQSRSHKRLRPPPRTKSWRRALHDLGSRWSHIHLLGFLIVAATQLSEFPNHGRCSFMIYVYRLWRH